MQLDSTIIASTNRGKIEEYSVLLGATPMWGRITDLLEAGSEPAPQEAGETYIENAILKARHACTRLNTPAIGDDGGLEVPSLGGVPGLLTARFTRAHGGATEAMKILARRAGLPVETPAGTDPRGTSNVVAATAHCAVALALPDGTTFTGVGTIEGTLQWPPHPEGPGLFPLFCGRQPWDCDAEVLLHRATAFEALLRDISSRWSSP